MGYNKGSNGSDTFLINGVESSWNGTPCTRYTNLSLKKETTTWRPMGQVMILFLIFHLYIYSLKGGYVYVYENYCY